MVVQTTGDSCEMCAVETSRAAKTECEESVFYPTSRQAGNHRFSHQGESHHHPDDTQDGGSSKLTPGELKVTDQQSASDRPGARRVARGKHQCEEHIVPRFDSYE